jgi:hypothetical protein
MLVCFDHAFPVPCPFCDTGQVTCDEATSQRHADGFNRSQAYRDHWSELHNKQDATPEWLDDWVARIPKTCGCGESFKSILLRVPPRFEDWFAWTVDVHNAVNEKLKKPKISLADARQIWQS